MTDQPHLSRFELQCLSLLWKAGEASARDVQAMLPDPPSYSTVRKIFERLEAKGAVERVGKDGRAVVYRSRVRAGAIIRREIRRFLESLFDGAGSPLLSHLADMNAITLEDLRELERELSEEADDRPESGRGSPRSVADAEEESS